MKRAVTIGLVVLMTGSVLMSSAGCGLILHPERRDATPSRHIDSKTLVLDCLWLLAGILPGVVALGVDLYYDTLYLSEDELKQREDVSVQWYNPAPTDCTATLRLVSGKERDLVAPVTVELAKGDTALDLSLPIPSGMNLADARLVLSVDGRDQVTWVIR